MEKRTFFFKIMILLLLSNAYIKAIEIAVISGNQAVCMGASDVPLEVDIDETTGTTPFITSWTTTNAEASIDCSDCEATTISNITEATEITLTVTDGNGFVCEEFLLIDVIEMNFVNAAGQQINHADIGHWGEDSGDGLTGFVNVNIGGDYPEWEVKNTLEENFIDLDGDRFFIEIKNNMANSINSVAEEMTVLIATLNDFNIDDDYDDDLTDIPLEETGPNTGIFRSKAQLLMSPDFVQNADDDFEAHDGLTGPVADDTFGDRTHRTSIDGGVSVKYVLNDGSTLECDNKIPVCDRQPEERKVLRVRCHVLNNPTTGQSYFGTIPQAENAVNAQITRANIAWAQACIKIERVGDILFENAPTVLNANGNLENILQDHVLDHEEGVLNGDSVSTVLETAAVIETYNNILEENIVEVFFVHNIAPYGLLNSEAAGLSIIPASGVTCVNVDVDIGLISVIDSNTVVFMHSELELGDATLAHEVGHCLENGKDSTHDKTIFYPNDLLINDAEVYKLEDYRRIQKADEFNCRKWREGTLCATGSHLLSNP